MPPRKTAIKRRKSHQKGGFRKTRKHTKSAITVGLIYANWCGHCQALKPEWRKMKRGLHGKNCHYLEIEDSDPHKDRKMAHVNSRLKMGKLEVNGYPTVFRIKDGKIEYYQGDRSASAMAQWFKGGAANQERTENEPERAENKLTTLQQLFGGKKQKGGDCGCGQKSIFGN
jgi:thioredoxin-like negative regulator of GroEL